MTLKEQMAQRRQRKSQIHEKRVKRMVHKIQAREEKQEHMANTFQALLHTSAQGELSQEERDKFRIGWLAHLNDLMFGRLDAEGFEQMYKSTILMRSLTRVLVDQTKTYTQTVCQQFELIWSDLQACAKVMEDLSDRFTELQRFVLRATERDVLSGITDVFDAVLQLVDNGMVMRAAYLTADILNGKVTVPWVHINPDRQRLVIPG